MPDPAHFWPDYPAIDDPARPRWHFAPPAYWMNDPNGASWHDGWCHVFYQHNPGADAWTDMHWGHARSRDLVHWEHLPVALRPQLADGEKYCCSGCLARTDDGRPHILYSSSPHDATHPLTQILATPDDANWLTWTQQVVTPFLAIGSHDGPAFGISWRDPFVFRTDGRTFLILGAELGDEAVIPLYENPTGDLRHWIYRGIIHRAPRTETLFFECPALVRFGEKWLLLTSPVREVEWSSGTLDLEHYRFHVERHGFVDESDHYYAAHPAIDPQGRVVLFGWAQKFPKNRGWSGCLAVPRRIWFDQTGDFCSEPVAELMALRTSETSFPSQVLSLTPLPLGLPGDAMNEGELTLERSHETRVHLEIAGVRLVIDATGARFDDRPPVFLAESATVKVRWLLDRSLLELFVNDRATYTRVVPFPSSATASLTAADGTARLVSGRAWALQAAPSSRAF